MDDKVKDREVEYVPYTHDIQNNDLSFVAKAGEDPNESVRGRERIGVFEMPYALVLFVGVSVPNSTQTTIGSTVVRSNMLINPYNDSTSSLVIPSDGIYEITYNVGPSAVIGPKTAIHRIVVNWSTSIATFESPFTNTYGQTCVWTYMWNFKSWDQVKLTYEQNSGSTETAYWFFSLKKIA